MLHWFTQVSCLVYLVVEGEVSSHLTLQISVIGVLVYSSEKKQLTSKYLL